MAGDQIGARKPWGLGLKSLRPGLRGYDEPRGGMLSASVRVRHATGKAPPNEAIVGRCEGLLTWKARLEISNRLGSCSHFGWRPRLHARETSAMAELCDPAR